MSEQQPEQTSVEPVSVNVEPAISNPSDAPGEPMAAMAQEPAQSPAGPALAAEPAQAAAELPADAPKSEAKADAAAPHAAKSDAAEAEAPHLPGKIIVMSSGDRAWADHSSGSGPQAGEGQKLFGRRRIGALAAAVALAVMAGALGGALATASLTQHGAGEQAAASGSHALETSLARIEADILTLKASLDHTAKLGMSQFNKTTDRLDKLERAQAEPAARIARLSEAVDKLRAAPAAPVPVAAAPAAPKDVTGSISPPAAPAPAATPKVEVGRLPTVEGWVLRDVARGGALIDGRRGIYEVYAGDFVPGLGRIDAVRRQDGRWVVVTSKGLIIAR